MAGMVGKMQYHCSGRSSSTMALFAMTRRVLRSVQVVGGIFWKELPGSSLWGPGLSERMFCDRLCVMNWCTAVWFEVGSRGRTCGPGAAQLAIEELARRALSAALRPSACPAFTAA